MAAVRLYLKVVLSFFLFALAVAAPSFVSAETCTGDCKLSYDFDTSTGCTAGREDACYTNNGLTVGDKSDAPDFYIVQGSGAAAGTGYFEGRGRKYSSGPGFIGKSIPGGPYNACTIRYYVKYGRTYFGYTGGPHGPGITVSGSGAGGCGMGGTQEQQQDGYYYYRAAQGTKCCSNNGSPGGDECDITGPTNPINLFNDRWYMLETRIVMDSSCSGTPSVSNCNGKYQFAVDGVLMYDRSDINWGGVQYGAKAGGINGPRAYQHTGWPVLEPYIYFDNYVVYCNNGTTPIVVGAPAGVNAPGTPLTRILHQNSYSQFEWSGGNHRNDCLGGARLGTTKYNDWWRDGSTKATISTLYGKNTDSTFDASCSGGGYQNGSLLVSLTGADDGAGILYYPAEVNYSTPFNVTMTWARLRSGQDYGNKTAIMGFASYKCATSGYSRCGGSKAACDEAQFGRFIAPGAIKSGGNYYWGVIERDIQGASTDSVASYTSSVQATLDGWDQVELSVDKTNNKYTFKVNGAVQVADRPFQLTTTAGAGNYNAANLTDLVYGVMDRCGAVGGNQLNLDSGAITTASTTGCQGWATGECPFVETPTSTPTLTCSANRGIRGRR